MMFLHIALICVLVFVFLSILYTTWKTGISPMPSSHQSRVVMLNLIPSTSSVCVDLGSGWGGMLRMLAAQYPRSRIIGYEQSWIPYFWSKVTCRHPNIEIHRTDFLSIAHPTDAVLLCYLCPKGMRRIENTLKGEASCLISHTFALPHTKPIALYTLSDRYKSPIYIYSL